MKHVNSIATRMQDNAPELEPQIPVKSWKGLKGRGGGYQLALTNLTTYRATTANTAGIWPFTNASTAPLIGSPIGRHHDTLQPVGCDPLSWFDAGLIFNPSQFVMGNPSVGKSTLIRKEAMGVMATGTNVLVPGDVKDEYVEEIRENGGQVIYLGPGRETMNILDPGEGLAAVEAIKASRKVPTDLRDQLVRDLLADIQSRRSNMVCSLIEIHRSEKISGLERGIVEAGVKWLTDNHDGTPILADLLNAVRAAHLDLMVAANAADAEGITQDLPRYRRYTENLENDLNSLCSGGTLGAMFNGPTTKPLHRDRSVCIAISGIESTQTDMLAAAYIASWSAAFGMINVAHAMADAKLEKHQRFLVILDEFWQPLTSGPGMVQRADAMTRLNRSQGVGIIYSTHTIKDLERIRSEEDRAAAYGIIERCGMIMLGGLSRRELNRVAAVWPLNRAEVNMIASWNAPRKIKRRKARPGTVQRGRKNPGLGKFCIKLPESGGIPIQTTLTATEWALDLHDTDGRIRKTEDGDLEVINDDMEEAAA